MDFFRHTMCCNALLKMSEAGMDLYYSMPILSTYIGHQSIEATNKYVRLTSEIYPNLLNKVNAAYKYIFPEIGIDASDFKSFTQNLQKNYPQLISYLEDNGYSKRNVARFSRDIQRIVHQAKLKGWKSYTDAYLAYVNMSKSSSYLREKRTIIGAIEKFEVLGQYPNRCQRHQILRTSSYDLLSAEFKSLIDHYCESEKNKGKKRTTIYTESHNATTFMLALHQKGIDSFNRITESAVFEIFFQNGRLCRSCSYKRNVAAVFKACISFFPKETCARILSYLLALREKRENTQYLSQEDVSRIKAVLTDNNPLVVLRDKAIGLLA